MKKLPIYVLSALLTVPAFATESGTLALDDSDKTPDTVSKISAVSNPKTRFPHGLQLGVGVSATSGLNGFVGYNNKNFDSFWWKRFGVRFDYASTSYIQSKIDSAVESVLKDGDVTIGDDLTIIDGSVKAKHIAALLDFYPFGDTWFLGGWRLSGGYYKGDFNIKANLQGEISDLSSDGFEFEFDDITYVYTGNKVYGSARADWKYQGPYIGTGFDLGLFAGFKIYFDAGVVFTDKTAKLDINVPMDNLQKCENGTCTPISGNTMLEDEFENAKAETLKDAQKDLDDIKYYPIIKLGFMYRF